MFSYPQFWVAVAFFLFLAAIFNPVRKVLISSLDSQINQIKLKIDEAQNLTKHEIKTIITRIGEGSKIVLTGDIEQIDNVYVNEPSTGLVHAVEKFKEYSIAGHMTFGSIASSARLSMAVFMKSGTIASRIRVTSSPITANANTQPYRWKYVPRCFR